MRSSISSDNISAEPSGELMWSFDGLVKLFISDERRLELDAPLK